ncbi:protein lifeguard 1-like [Hemicordylus capensis]|uniref:protein lifeguard 1-like n=1 Tax=Hemicordylus capensis TaxID=884348 RepID=UPI00230364AF|nr:protein lifeguard 1-like [Hemicordylus capensis]
MSLLKTFFSGLSQPGSPLDPNTQLHPAGTVGQATTQHSNNSNNEDGPSIGSVNLDAPTIDLDDRNLRKTFVCKVCLLLAIQFPVTVALAAVLVVVEDVKELVKTYSFIGIVPYALVIICFIVLVCCKTIRRKLPWNLLLLSIATLSTSCWLGFSIDLLRTENLHFALIKMDTIFIALGVSVVIHVAVIIFAIKIRYDFTPSLKALVISLIMIIMVSLLMVFMNNHVLTIVGSFLSMILFLWVLVLNTQMIWGNKKKRAFNPDNYALAAFIEYIAMIFIFDNIMMNIHLLRHM